MPAGRPKEIDEALVLSMKQNGYTNEEIANMLGIHKITVSKILKTYKGQYTTQQGYKKINLTDEQVNYLVSLKKAGYSYKEITRRTGLSNTFVAKIIKEKLGGQSDGKQ